MMTIIICRVSTDSEFKREDKQDARRMLKSLAWDGRLIVFIEHMLVRDQFLMNRQCLLRLAIFFIRSRRSAQSFACESTSACRVII